MIAPRPGQIAAARMAPPARWLASYAARRAKTERQKSRMAEMVASGWTIIAAGRAIGVSEGRARKIWTDIRADLGWQAA